MCAEPKHHLHAAAAASPSPGYKTLQPPGLAPARPTMPRPVPPSPPQLPPGPQRAGVPASAARLAPHAPPTHTPTHPLLLENLHVLQRKLAPVRLLPASRPPRRASLPPLPSVLVLPQPPQPPPRPPPAKAMPLQAWRGGGGRSSLRQEVRLPPPAAFMSVFKHRRSEGWPHVPAAASSSCPLLSSAPSRPRSPPDARRRHPASSIPAAGARRAPPAEVR